MEKNFIDYLKAMNAPAEHIEALKKEKLPEGFKVKEKAGEFIETQSTLDAATKKDIETAAVAKQIPIFKTTLLQKVNKAYGFGFSRSEIEEMEADAFISTGLEKIKAKIDESGKHGDDDLRKQLSAKDREISELAERMEKIKSESETKLTELQKQNQREKYEGQAAKAYNYVLEKYELSKGLPDGAKKRLKADWLNEILSFAKVDFDKNINDGKGKKTYAVTNMEGEALLNFAKNGKFKTLDDVVVAMLERDGVLKVSNGGEGGEGGTMIMDLGQYKVTDKTSPRLRAKIEKLNEAEGK